MPWNRQLSLNINRLIDAGLPDHFLEDGLQARMKPSQVDSWDPNSAVTGGGKLALDHFMVAFIILGAGMASAGAAFVMEMLGRRHRRLDQGETIIFNEFG